MSLQLVFVGAILPGIHPTHIHGMHWRVRLDARGKRAQAAKNRVIVVPN